MCPSYSVCSVYSVAKEKAPPERSGGALVAKLCPCELRNAHPGRPAEAGMMVPVVVREAEHPDPAYFRTAVEVKRAAAADAFPSGLRLSAAPHAVPPASTAIELAS